MHGVFGDVQYVFCKKCNTYLREQAATVDGIGHNPTDWEQEPQARQCLIAASCCNAWSPIFQKKTTSMLRWDWISNLCLRDIQGLY